MSKKKKNAQTHRTSENSCPKCGHDAGAAAFCPDCGAKVRGASTDEKRARLEGQGSGGRGMWPVIVIVAAIVVGAAGYVFYAKGGSVQRAESIAATTTAGVGAAATGAGITIPVADVNDGKAHYYAWDAPSGRKIQFFVLKSSDGVIRAAFDACDVCYASKKGYRQEGDFMVCNNCGQRFASVRVNEVKGGCNPSPLDRTIVGENLVITAAALQSGARYF